ncbi:tail fiber protein [Xenorhabdus lircayensis]|nr:phage tail protein [Xenorhabdus lircayensis]
MVTNEFLPFGIADGANVLSNDEYSTLAARTNGFSSGVAKSPELNTVWRQASVIATVVAQFIAETTGNDVLDDGNLATLQAELLNALKMTVGSNIPVASRTAAGITKLSNAIDSDAENVAATPRAVKQISATASQAKSTADTAHYKAVEANANANVRLSKVMNGEDIPDKKVFINNLGLRNTVNQAENALDKSKNGADIPDVKKFVDNLWLRGTVDLAQNAVSANGGDYPSAFRFKQVGTLPQETSTVSLNSLGHRPAYSLVSNTKYDWYNETTETGIIRGHLENIEGYAVDINHRRVLTVAPDGLLTVNRIALTDFTDFDNRYDSRYISRVRLGRELTTVAALSTTQSRVPGGHVMTGIGNFSTQTWVGVNQLIHRPVQCLIEGQWRSIDVEV